MCQLTGVDIATYMFETDKKNNAVRDAAAAVIHQRNEMEAERRKAQMQMRGRG